MITTAIITAKRRINVIDRSLESYFEHTLAPFPYVFAEPGATNFYWKPMVRLRENDRTKGCFDNWWSAASWLLQNVKSDYYLMCEDDILWSKDSFYTLTNFANPNLVLTGWTPLVSAEKGRIGWGEIQNLNRHGLCGSLALLIPRKIFGDLVYHSIMTRVNQIHLDTMIGFALQDLGVKIYNHQPSLVTHIGAYNSTFDLSVVGEETISARRCYATCDPSRWKYVQI